jgi:hypothetical protein
VSHLTADDAPDAEETLYHFKDTKKDALVALCKMVVFRAFGDVPIEGFLKIAGRLSEIVANEDISKCLNIGGITYYVRELTESEASVLSKIGDKNCVVFGLQAEGSSFVPA